MIVVILKKNQNSPEVPVQSVRRRTKSSRWMRTSQSRYFIVPLTASLGLGAAPPVPQGLLKVEFCAVKGRSSVVYSRWLGETGRGGKKWMFQ
ncbi:hypothetical protein SAMN05216299_101152 [Nitrosospira sp. Nsp14]|nr:hypothetical protein SAMN05216299_101152 [Nitrosospira sp. Nsp14]